MTKEELTQIIKEEVAKELASAELVNEIYDLDQVKYSASVRKQVDDLVAKLFVGGVAPSYFDKFDPAVVNCVKSPMIDIGFYLL